MKLLTEQLTRIVSDAFEKCGYDRTLGSVTVSDRQDLCQFQCNGAFGAAKQAHKPPFAVADEVAAVLRENAMFSKAEMVKPGFLNLSLSDEAILDGLRAVSADEFLGVPQAERPETIIIDYGGPNVAKPLHIGHLRSAIIGESLKRLARATGNRVLGDVHLGDWGLQIGLVIAELSERHPDWACFAEDFPADGEVPRLDADTLCEIYPFASKKSKADEAFSAKAHRATAELQTGRPGYLALWKEILRVSCEDLKKNYAALGVDFELWYGESDADKYLGELMERLKEKNLLRESDGALVVDVAEEGDKAPMPPMIVRKSDNSSIYATTDLATIIQREKDFAPDRIWYVVDKRQGLHFTQVFRCAKKAGLVPESTELCHIGFGTMNGADGKPYKTRDGGVMRLSDLIDTATKAAHEKMESSGFVSDDEKQGIARKIGVAAVKFGDLINNPAKDYIFDLDKFLSFEGKTGTYLLYTISRINSICKRLGSESAEESFSGVYTGVERELALNILLTGEAFRRAMQEKAPNYICENAYQLAAVFSRFYHDNRIIDEPDAAKKATWISLIRLTRRLLLKHLDVLSIEPVEQM